MKVSWSGKARCGFGPGNDVGRGGSRARGTHVVLRGEQVCWGFVCLVWSGYFGAIGVKSAMKGTEVLGKSPRMSCGTRARAILLVTGFGVRDKKTQG